MARTSRLSIPPAFILVLVVAAATVLFLASHQETQAGSATNSFEISPASKNIGAGSSTSVQLVVNPGAASLAVWVVEIGFDPDKVKFNSCTSVASPPGASAVSDCDVKDTGGSPDDDTVVSVGGILFSDNERGLDNETVLATVKFDAVGTVGQCSPLTIDVTADLGPDPDAASTIPVVTNGELCIVADAGVDRKWGDSDCNGNVLPRDGQALLRNLAAQTPLTQTDPCTAIGGAITVAGKDGTKWGDWDCNGTVLPRDGQALLRHLAAQTPLTQTGDCAAIGTLVQVSD